MRGINGPQGDDSRRSDCQYLAITKYEFTFNNCGKQRRMRSRRVVNGAGGSVNSWGHERAKAGESVSYWSCGWGGSLGWWEPDHSPINATLSYGNQIAALPNSPIADFIFQPIYSMDSGWIMKKILLKIDIKPISYANLANTDNDLLD